MTRVTANKISAAIQAKFGMDVRVFRGEGYFFFYSDDTSTANRLAAWPCVSVYTYRMNDMTLAQWVEAFEALMEGGDELHAAKQACRETYKPGEPIKLRGEARDPDVY